RGVGGIPAQPRGARATCRGLSTYRAPHAPPRSVGIAIGNRLWQPSRLRCGVAVTAKALMTVVTPSTLGPVRTTYAGAADFPPMARAYSEVSRVARETGLYERTPWFYGLLGGGIALALGGAIAGFVLLGQSWFQLLIAAALGIIFTQIAFLAHEAAHRQILASGPASDRLARLLAASIGLSAAWWDRKHSRHHGNPNRVSKDPDIAIDTISFLEEDAASARGVRRAITRHQGWLLFPLLTLVGLNLHA